MGARRRARLWSPLAGAVVVVLAACGIGAGDDEVGMSHIDMGDVPGSTLESRLTGTPVPVTGQLFAHDDGCVTVVVDGVERLPVWPDGTRVTPSDDNPGRYVVEPAGRLRLTAGGSGGDTFTADGIVADGRSAGPSGGEPPGKAETFLDFCDVEAAPIAFPDAATFKIGQ